MKRLILFSLLALHLSVLKSQPLGFVESECGIITNPFYSIHNYTFGSHGSGYNLYHNGVAIAGQEGSFGGYSGGWLKFIDDTTGFFISQRAGGPALYYKIIGNSVIHLGDGPGFTTGYFIVNAYTVFMTSDIYEVTQYNHFFIGNYSEINPPRIIVEDTSVMADITIIDTIIGSTLCQGLSEINYRYLNGNDTINYKILFYIKDSAYSINDQIFPEVEIYPNPTSSILNFQVSKLFGKIQTLEIYNFVGQLQLAKTDDFSELDISAFTSGIYILVLTNFDNKKLTRKIIKE